MKRLDKRKELPSFETLSESRVEYQSPNSDAYRDVGDGNTDAYQIYVHEKYKKTI